MFSIVPLALFLQIAEASSNSRVKCTFIHFLKMCLSLSCAGIEVGMLLLNLVVKSDLNLAQVIVNSAGAFIWLCISVLVRLQFVREQRTQKFIRIWWGVMFISQAVILPLELIFAAENQAVEDSSVEEVLLFVFFMSLGVLGCCYPNDTDDWTSHSNSILDTFMSALHSRSMSEEEVWRSLSPENVPSELHMMQPIRAVAVVSCEEEAEDREVVRFIQYQIKVTRGRSNPKVSETHRTYSEFYNLYSVYKPGKLTTQLPLFPVRFSLQ